VIKRLLARLDPRVVIAAVAAVLLLAAYWAVVALSEDYYLIQAPPGSTFSSDDAGTKVLFNYLRRLDIETEALQSFDELPEAGTIVVLADEPLEVETSRTEGRRLIAWVEAGGRLVMAGPEARAALRQVPVGAGRTTGGDETTLTPLLPSFYADGVRDITVGPNRFLADDASWVTHVKDIEGQVFATRAYGEGELVWISTTAPFANAYIGEGDNARFATLVTAAEQPVYFDEYHHGFVRGGSVWDRLGTGGQAGVTVALLALAVWLAAVSRRLGPAIDPVPQRPVRTGAYISSLAELYRAAGARREALDSLADGLRASAAIRYGTLDAAIARHPEIATALSRAQEAHDTTPTEEAFVSIARDLARARQEVEGRHE